MQRTYGLVAAGCAAFLLALLLGLPAGAAIRWLAPGSVQVMGAEGTVWHGSAHSVAVGGIRLSHVRWRLSALSLLTGRLSAEVETQLGDSAANGHVVVTLSGMFKCEPCRFYGTTASLRPLAPVLQNIDGHLGIELQNLAIRERWPTQAQGTVTLANVRLGLPGTSAVTGETASFVATVDENPVATDGVISAMVRDTAGPLELNAHLILTPPNNFGLQGRIKARANTSPDLANALTMLGQQNADGSTELSLSGSF